MISFSKASVGEQRGEEPPGADLTGVPGNRGRSRTKEGENKLWMLEESKKKKNCPPDFFVLDLLVVLVKTNEPPILHCPAVARTFLLSLPCFFHRRRSREDVKRHSSDAAAAPGLQE